MTRPQRPCLNCGRLHRNQHSRCSACQSDRDRIRNARRSDLYGGTWPTYSKKKRRETPFCQICGRTKEQLALINEVLTVDHPTDLVMCRPCNSSRRQNH